MERLLKGIALVEVLITTVITAIGTLAVVMLLVNLNNNSTTSKLRDEALSIAQSKIESLQNNFDRGLYNEIKSKQQQVINGQNSKFILSWQVLDKKQADIKVIKVWVKWQDKSANAEQIELSHIINWNNILKSASIASYGVDGGFVYLSPNQSGEKGDRKIVELPQNTKTSKLPNGMKKYTDNDANIHILDTDNRLLLTLFDQKDKDEKQRKILHISGRLFLQHIDENNLQIIASEPAYCFFPENAKKLYADSWKYRDYICITAYGWRGKIGLIYKNNQNIYRACPASSREYLHYSLKDNTHLYQSGIINNYSAQDFVITDKHNPQSCNKTILSLQESLDANSDKYIINAEHFVVMESEKVHSLSGKILGIGEKAIEKLTLSIADKSHDCRLLNQLDNFNDAYSCVVEMNSASNAWEATLRGKGWTKHSAIPICEFNLHLEKNNKSANLDLDLADLCK